LRVKALSFTLPRKLPPAVIQDKALKENTLYGRKIFRKMQFSLVAPEGVINFAAQKEGRVIIHAPKPL